MFPQSGPGSKSPCVLAVGGHDPSGGAGIQADIEAIAALGAHAATAVTCLTVQDTVNVQAIHPVEPSILRAQVQAVFADLAVAVVKIGLLGSVAAATTVADVLEEHPGLPVVLDPVLAAGGGTVLSDEALREVMRRRLVPRAFLVTPNSVEAQQLTGESLPDRAAIALVELGAGNVLLTGGHDAGDEVQNLWFAAGGAREAWRWPRLPGEYHGSGCTLASACAALLARELPIGMALRLAQAFTHDALEHAHRPGHGQSIPRRVLALRPAE